MMTTGFFHYMFSSICIYLVQHDAYEIRFCNRKLKQNAVHLQTTRDALRFGIAMAAKIAIAYTTCHIINFTKTKQKKYEFNFINHRSEIVLVVFVAPTDYHT